MSFFFNLCSSSSGNATFVGDREGGLLFDAGVGIRNFSKWLLMGGLTPDSVKGIFLTHEHSDHVKGVSVISIRHGIPVYGSEDTIRCLLDTGRLTGEEEIHVIRQETHLHGFTVSAAPTSHDSPGSVCYRVDLPDAHSVGICTDLGYVSPLILEIMSGVDHLLIESNYDEDMLQNGPYPYHLKKRISSKSGHLSNTQCAEMIGRMIASGTRSFSLGHLSEHNNLPFLAYEASTGYLTLLGLVEGRDYRLSVLPKVTTGEAVLLE